jgi:outer membrane lipoprotein LolB
MAQLHRDDSGAVLTTAEQRRYRAASLEGLARDALGWALPVASLRYWVSGKFAPDADARVLERDAAGRPVLYVQHAWRVRIADHAEGAARPRRMQLNYGELEVRLVIDGFEVPSAGGAAR